MRRLSLRPNRRQICRLSRRLDRLLECHPSRHPSHPLMRRLSLRPNRRLICRLSRLLECYPSRHPSHTLMLRLSFRPNRRLSRSLSRPRAVSLTHLPHPPTRVLYLSLDVVLSRAIT